MCKHWLESPGNCKFGLNCHYAHGEEELAESDRMAEEQARLKENYKSQNCSQFYRDKLCFYGKRCIFRHEFRSFTKLHRHYYMVHLAAVSLTHHDILSEAKNAPDGSEDYEPGTPSTSESSDGEYDITTFSSNGKNDMKRKLNAIGGE